MTNILNLWNGAATLAEGPAWDSLRACLWFVDIKQQQVHCYSSASGQVRSWDCPAQIGWVFPTNGETLLAGLQTGLALFDPASGMFEHIIDVENDLPSNRLNDASVDATGNVWFGTMDDGEHLPSGRYYKWDGKSIRPLSLDPAPITNGPALSPDGRTLYYVDTAGRALNAANLDEEGKVSSTKEFARIAPEDGYPDGVIVDSAGNVWLGLWGGWRARLYSSNGEILHEVRFPASNVTKVALGGPDLKTAFVTTARAGLSEQELAEQPEAGSLFAFQVDVAGIANPMARV